MLGESFWRKVDQEGGLPPARPSLGHCWVWIGRILPSGYGRFHNSKGHRAHKQLWESLNGPVPEGLELDHLCRNHACVNPAHLEMVTHAENMARGIIAKKEFCLRGHPLSGQNIRLYGPGWRICKTCRQLRTLADRAHLPRRNKLSPSQVRQIYALRTFVTHDASDRGEYTISNIATRYGVSRTAVQSILNGRTWRSVLGPPQTT